MKMGGMYVRRAAICERRWRMGRGLWEPFEGVSRGLVLWLIFRKF